MTAYSGGRTFEWKVRDHLRDEGYEVVRSAGSKTPVDLVAWKPSQLLMVQCKRDGVCSPAEWDRLVQLASWVAAIPVLAVNGPRGRGVAYWRLTGPKLRGRAMGAQPAEPFLTDVVLAGSPLHRVRWAGIGQEWVEVQDDQGIKIPELTPEPPLGDETGAPIALAARGGPGNGIPASLPDAGLRERP